MAIFGGGVRPELGRTDYSEVARGGQLAGQMAARGAETMAQGIASAGQSVAKAIDQYQQNKVIAAEQTGKFEAGVQAGIIKLDALPENIAKAANKLVKDGAVGLKEATLLGAFADQFQKAETEKLTRDYRNLQMSLLQQTANDASALGSVVSNLDMYRDTDGQLDTSGIMQAYVQSGGRNMTPLLQALESMRTTPGFEPSVKQMKVPGSEEVVTVVQTGPNSSQVIPQVKEAAVPASVQDRAAREKMILEASELWKEGKKREAYAKMVSAGTRNQFGGSITMDDMESMFKDINDEQPANKPASAPSPTKEIRVRF
jgi:hypothetical protein